MYEHTDTKYTADQIYRRELRQIDALSEQEEAAIHERIRNGDTNARHELITPNLPFAVAYVKRFIGCGIEYDDLRQLAAIGLMEAADKFDPDEEAAFRTFAVYHIKSVVIREIETQGRTVRVPSHLKQAALRYRRFVYAFQRDYGREPSDVEVEISLGFPRSKIETIRKCTLPIASLDQPIGEDGDELTLGDTIESGEDMANTIADEDERERLHKDLNRLLNDLPSDEENALREYYYRGKSYAQIAEQTGTAESDVRNSANRGLRHLRTYRARQTLNQYIDYCVGRYAYKSSFTTWQESGSSSTERAALKLLEFGERSR